MGKPKAKSIDVPDPFKIIEAEKEANRTDVSTPFGTSRWEGNTQVTEFGPEMEAMRERMFNLGMQDSQRFEPPAFMGDLASAIGGKVGERYGMSDLPMAGSAKPQQEMKQPEQGTTPIGPSLEGAAEPQPQPPPQAPPNPGYMPPGQPMDPGQLEQLRRRMSGGGYQDQFFGGRRMR